MYICIFTRNNNMPAQVIVYTDQQGPPRIKTISAGSCHAMVLQPVDQPSHQSGSRIIDDTVLGRIFGAFRCTPSLLSLSFSAIVASFLGSHAPLDNTPASILRRRP
jgi:hypothetical protein